MSKKTLAEVKAIFGEKVHEVDTAFLVNDFGKYRPSITFVVPKDFDDNPLGYVTSSPIKEMLANMNVDWDGKTSVLFGDFWTSRKGGACFRPKPIAQAQHVLVRVDWGGAFNRTRGPGHVDGSVYYRYAPSNGRGTGYTYVVVPLGFYRELHNPEIDGDIPSKAPSFAKRAEEIRKTFAEHAEAERARAEAASKAKAKVEAESRQAKAIGLGALLEAVNRRRKALGEHLYKLEEAHFGIYIEYYNEVRDRHLYTETAVATAEREVTQLEEKAQLKNAVEELQIEFESKLGATNIKLSVTDSGWSKGVKLIAEDVDLSRSFSYSLEGVTELRESWSEFKAEVEEKRAEIEAIAKKEAMEAKLLAEGYPADFTCVHERGHGKTHRECWVVQPDGKTRKADNERYSHHKHTSTVWNVIYPGQIALMWEKRSAAGEHYFTVVHMQTETLTEAQVETICEILEEVEERWDGSSGLASGRPSPSIGDGWLHPETGESLTKGFQTTRQKRKQGYKRKEEANRMASGPFASLASLRNK